MKKMSVSQKRKVRTGVVAGLAATMLLAGTFAWVQMTSERINRMKTTAITDGSVVVNEKFIPNDNWEIGTENEKEVSITNNGNQRVFARVSYEEVLRVYKDGAEEVALDTPEEYPVMFNTAAYSGAEWLDIPSDNFNEALPNGVKVKAKGSKKTEINAAGQEGEVSTVSYIVYNELETGGAQKVSADIQAKNLSGGPSVADWTYDIKNIKYYSYSGLENFAADWAGNNTVLGKADTLNGVAYDYTAAGLPGVTLPVATTPQTGANAPAPKELGSPIWEAKFEVDSTLDSALYTVYDGNNMVATVPAALATPGTGANKWFYDQTDGYFYYLGVLNSGETTPIFLKALGLGANATKAYSDMTLDLIVNLEAIQAVKAAVTDGVDTENNNGGWGVDETKPVAKYLTSLVDK